MLGELRTGLNVALGQKNARKSETFGILSIAGLYIEDGQACLALHCGSGLGRLTGLAESSKKKFLTDSETFHKHQSFGALLSEHDSYGFAHINRNIDLLLRNPVITRLDLRFALVTTPVFASRADLGIAEEEDGVSTRPNLLSPTVRDDIFQPFPSLRSKAERNLSTIDAKGRFTIRANTGQTFERDESQISSAVNTFTKPVSVIRGPPGTGKSFLGSWTVKTIPAH
ncbi:ATPase [Drepanopeziza brunnea f. sp. 'multigermtubi' MB_m1]|uniref:ATPase n=1 Tax=Marssonina brunnea f. sp. multigermtubi (strain MB_m1) TaxID=1072389 RepID=K1W9J3_MARBU|nr:ATPase [Drepanopeziza brunnea f. sp. 'multigermtubi' MB_m1]EKD13920.1 ATPase [Drepanopeziza brunnea f. sp. 'multigermtubi' MB_m1]